MSGVLLDTSAYSGFKRGNPEIKSALQTAESVALSAVAVGELLAGFHKGAQRRKNEEEFAAFLDSPRVSVLPVDEDTAERYAVILDALRQAGTPIPTNDIWIAACAMQYGLTVLTTDAHFLRVPQVITRSFEAAS